MSKLKANSEYIITEKGIFVPTYNMNTYNNNDFLERYLNNHKLCPKCGSPSCESTCVGYLVDMNNTDDYKDLNNCRCSNCGDTHTTHERVKNNVQVQN